MAQTLISLINLLAALFSLLILARIVFSWVQVDRYNPVVNFVIQVTEPILAPIRNIMPSGMMLDFSPMIAMLLINWVIVPILSTIVRSIF
ncbi:MAG: YggT family protein [Chloroflexi bacterium]|nr:YggT family protein [Chloroflexota bacterium]